MKLHDEIKNLEDLAYITRRKLKDENGETRGAVFMWGRKGEEEFNYMLEHCVQKKTVQIEMQ